MARTKTNTQNDTRNPLNHKSQEVIMKLCFIYHDNAPDIWQLQFQMWTSKN